MVSKALQELNHDELLRHLSQGIQTKARRNKKSKETSSSVDPKIQNTSKCKREDIEQFLDCNEKKISNMDNDDFSLATETTLNLEVDEEEALTQKLKKELQKVDYELALVDGLSNAISTEDWTAVASIASILNEK